MKSPLCKILLLVPIFACTILEAQIPTLDWVIRLQADDYASSNRLTTDQHGHIYSIGPYRGSMDLDPDTGTQIVTNNASGVQSYIQKLDTSGQLIWGKTTAGSDEVLTYDVVVSGDQNVYTCGSFRGLFFMDSTTFHVSTGQSGYIQKLDSNGNHLWGHSFVGNGWGILDNINLDRYGNVYCTGYYNGTLDLDPGPGSLTNTGMPNIGFVLKFDPNGNLISSIVFDGHML